MRRRAGVLRPLWSAAVVAAVHLALSPAQAATVSSGKDKPAAAPAAAASNTAILELLREIDGLKREVQSLRGQVEDRGHEIEQLRRVVTDLDQRVGAGGAGAQAPLETVAPAAGGQVAGTPSPESSLQVETQAPPAAPEGFEPDPAFKIGRAHV